MDGLDEVERLSLEQSIAQIEAVIARDSTSVGSRITSMLVRFVENARQRLGHLDQQDQSISDEKRKQGAQELAIAYLVEKEIALNEAEREQYGAFLAKEFFTKSDFGALEGFYTNTWDRLSEGGKAQMSHRVWEGVRQGEYQFSELPEQVKEKEAKRLYELISAKSASAEFGHIPAADRADFTAAWNAGKKDVACTILDRPSFKENVALSPQVVKEEEVRGSADRVEVAAGASVTPAATAPTVDVSSGGTLSEEALGNLNAIPKTSAANGQKLAKNDIQPDR